MPKTVYCDLSLSTFACDLYYNNNNYNNNDDDDDDNYYYHYYNHKNYNFLECDWFEKLLFSH